MRVEDVLKGHGVGIGGNVGSGFEKYELVSSLPPEWHNYNFTDNYMVNININAPVRISKVNYNGLLIEDMELPNELSQYSFTHFDAQDMEFYFYNFNARHFIKTDFNFNEIWSFYYTVTAGGAVRFLTTDEEIVAIFIDTTSSSQGDFYILDKNNGLIVFSDLNVSRNKYSYLVTKDYYTNHQQLTSPDRTTVTLYSYGSSVPIWSSTVQSRVLTSTHVLHKEYIYLQGFGISPQYYPYLFRFNLFNGEFLNANAPMLTGNGSTHTTYISRDIYYFYARGTVFMMSLKNDVVIMMEIKPSTGAAQRNGDWFRFDRDIYKISN